MKRLYKSYLQHLFEMLQYVLVFFFRVRVGMRVEAHVGLCMKF